MPWTSCGHWAPLTTPLTGVVHERLYNVASKWRERKEDLLKMAESAGDPNCTFIPEV